LDTDGKGSLNRQDVQKFLDEIAQISQLATVPDISVEEVSAGYHATVMNPIHEHDIEAEEGGRGKSGPVPIKVAQYDSGNDNVLPNTYYENFPSTDIDIDE